MKPSRLFLLLLFVASTTPSQADWEARQVTVNTKTKATTNAYIRSAKTLWRIDIDTGQAKLTTIADVPKNKAWLLYPDTKMAMELDMQGVDTQLLSCTQGDVEGCLKARGFAKSGSETIRGHTCDIYDGSIAIGKQKRRTRLWRPTDIAEVPTIRTMQKDGSDVWFQSDMLDIKLTPQAASYFTVPSDYKSVGSVAVKSAIDNLGGANALGGLLKGFKLPGQGQ